MGKQISVQLLFLGARFHQSVQATYAGEVWREGCGLPEDPGSPGASGAGALPDGPGAAASLVLQCVWWGPLPAWVGWCSEVEGPCRLHPAVAVALEVSRTRLKVTGGRAAAGAADVRAQDGD